jgi:hypothetical protein
MTREEKDLLIKDLCGRLPYKVKGIITYNGDKDIFTVKGIHNDNLLLSECEACKIEDFKPYLRPLSSMTEEEEDEYELVCRKSITTQIDWLNKNMFDYRGLIEKGLALEAPESMYNS